jgi:hypothetical protein
VSATDLLVKHLRAIDLPACAALIDTKPSARAEMLRHRDALDTRVLDREERDARWSAWDRRAQAVAASLRPPQSPEDAATVASLDAADREGLPAWAEATVGEGQCSTCGHTSIGRAMVLDAAGGLHCTFAAECGR